MPPTVFFCCAFFLLQSTFLGCLARDTINIKSKLSETTGETLVSAGGKFELGFFTPNGSSSSHKYVGIWYHNLQPKTYVWVANRDKPFSDYPGIFSIADDGNLKVLDKFGKTYWCSGLEPRQTYRGIVARLLDSGNLVLSYSNQPNRFLWQSFEHPVDTFLPGMKMNDDISLTSWTSNSDPMSGNFSFEKDVEKENEFVIYNGYLPHWRSGGSDEFDSLSYKIQVEMKQYLNISGPVSISSNFSPTISISNSNDWRIVMNNTGEVQFWRWNKQRKQWSLEWQAPKDQCGVINLCGNFGRCNRDSPELCKCLPGFNPSFPENWNHGDFTGGCSRNMSICGSRDDTFTSLKMIKIGKEDSKFAIEDSTECKKKCHNDCRCQAYSYTPGTMRRGDLSGNFICWIWTDNLNNLQEGYLGSNEVHELFVRVAISSIESTSRSCPPCGTILIPYPVSTGSNCGDSMYSGFYCNDSTGMTQFKAQSGMYNVTRINQETRTFSIQIQEVDNCDNQNGNSTAKIKHLNKTLSLPFRLVNVTLCKAENENFVFDAPRTRFTELEISWDPPREPTCKSSEDCKDWPHSACNVTNEGMQRCICNANFTWDRLAINCTRDSKGDGYHKQIEGSSGNNKTVSLIVGITVASIAVASSSIICLWLRRKKIAIGKGRRGIGSKEAVGYHTEKCVEDIMDADDFTEEDQKRIDVRFFNLHSIHAATNNFSDTNKLGQGGFGSVYKGTLPEGQEVAIKRLSSVSVQGLEEFKNEVLLIAKLQHRNLVKLLGYCLQGDEKILVYEYMPNKSLDFFIFDSNLCELLNWEMRFNIILGIARGILYLHQDSRLRIIHRDLKTSNILLDEEMNPKISDFGLARIVEGKMSEGSTNRVVGTFGYMSPEYAIDGLFSVKSDVFSFGVVMLEILSGRKNTAYFNLLAYAWKFWREDNAEEFMDETLRESCNIREFLKCVHVALLCVQEDPVDRPTMSNVVVYLSSERDTYPTPKQPAFITRANLAPASSASSSKQDTIMDLTATSLETL